MTTFIRPGSGLPMESQVLRPIMMGLPMVACLKYLRSPGRYHGRLLFRPITRFRDMATIKAFRISFPLEFVHLHLDRASGKGIPKMCGAMDGGAKRTRTYSQRFSEDRKSTRLNSSHVRISY